LCVCVGARAREAFRIAKEGKKESKQERNTRRCCDCG
jgi:hypothetical protein